MVCETFAAEPEVGVFAVELRFGIEGLGASVEVFVVSWEFLS